MTNTGGIVSTHADGLSASIKRNQDNATKEQTRIAAVEAKLNKQYSDLDSKMASISALATYMTQQITNWNKP
jgi:flagellar hook-associated protein 2